MSLRLYSHDETYCFFDRRKKTFETIFDDSGFGAEWYAMMTASALKKIAVRKPELKDIAIPMAAIFVDVGKKYGIYRTPFTQTEKLDVTIVRLYKDDEFTEANKKFDAFTVKQLDLIAAALNEEKIEEDPEVG